MDHANLTYYHSPQRLTQRQMQWVIELMEYDIMLQHKPGKAMVPADALSRRHDHAQNVEDMEDQIGLPDRLFVNLLDIELQDAVVKGQLEDSTAQEALA